MPGQLLLVLCFIDWCNVPAAYAACTGGLCYFVDMLSSILIDSQAVALVLLQLGPSSAACHTLVGLACEQLCCSFVILPAGAA